MPSNFQCIVELKLGKDALKILRSLKVGAVVD